MGIKHAFTSAKDDGIDETVVRPSDWNADHVGVIWSPDYAPSSPDSHNDEFDSLTGWSTLGTLNVSNVTDMPSNWHAIRSAVSGTEVNGIYKACPTMPFIVSAKITDIWALTTGGYAGILLADSTPTYLYTIGPAYGSGYGGWNDLFRAQWSNRTTRSAYADSDARNYAGVGLYPPFFPYLRIAVFSSSNFHVYASAKGTFWNVIAQAETTTGYGNWTIANVGLAVGSPGTAATTDVYFDWIRFRDSTAIPCPAIASVGTYGDECNTVTIDASWVLRNISSVTGDGSKYPILMDAQGDAFTRPITDPAADFEIMAHLTGLTDGGGMLGLCAVDNNGSGIGFSRYNDGNTYIWNLSSYNYGSTGPSIASQPPIGDHWLHLRRTGTAWYGRFSADYGLTWSGWTGGQTDGRTITKIGIVRAYSSGGTQTVNLERFIYGSTSITIPSAPL